MRFYIDLILQNPTAQDFSASSAGSIAAKSYRVYVGNKLLAFGSLGSISGVTLPAGGSYTFPDIYVEIPTIELLKHAYSLTGEADNWKKLFAGKSAQQPNGTTSVRYRAKLGSLSTPEEIAKITQESGGSSGTGGAAAAPNVPLVYSGEDPRSLARPLVAARGWSDSEYQCLVQLWNRESQWNPHAQNSSSGAYGIPQALPGSKMATAGADWQTNPVTQINWGLGYIAGRYGTPCSAWAHSNAVGWY